MEGSEKQIRWDEYEHNLPPCECGETNAAWYGSMAGSRIWRCQKCWEEEERRKAMRDLERERKEKVYFLKEMGESHDYCPVCNGLLRKSTNAGTDCFCSIGMLKDYFGV